MPGSLDSCISNVYADGAIPASAGIPPVRVLMRGPLAVSVAEAAAATAAQDYVAPSAVARSAMLAFVFVNSDGTPRQANADGVMVNL